MARGDYSAEVKSAMKQHGKEPDSAAEKRREGDTPAELRRDKQRGIVEGSPRDEQLDTAAMQQATHPSLHAPPHHVNAAASIAHAILTGSSPRSNY